MPKPKSPDKMTQAEFEAWREKQNPTTWEGFKDQWEAGKLSSIEDLRLKRIHRNLSG